MKKTKPTQEEVIAGVKNDTYHWSCFNCGAEFSVNEPYSNPMTVHEGTCDICGAKTVVGPSRKIFGYYRSI